MRALYLSAIFAIACGTSVHSSLDTDAIGDGGEPTVKGGTETLSTGGNVDRAHPSGGSPHFGGDAGTVGGESGNGGEAINTAGGNEGGAGGSIDAIGGAATSNAGAGGAPVVPEAPFWKHCGSAICNDNELCVSRNNQRVCIVAGPSECAPNETVGDQAFMSGCDDQPIQCSKPYRRCLNVVNIGAVGICPTMGKDPFTLQIWSCGPPL